MDIDLLVIPDCPNDDAASELIRTAVADTRVRATISRYVIATLDEAQQRGFTGSQRSWSTASTHSTGPTHRWQCPAGSTPPQRDCEASRRCATCDRP